MMNPTKYLFGREVERNAITYFTFLSTSLPNKYLVGFIISFIRSLLTQHIQVILFKESQILSCFCKLALFHSFTDIPVHKCSLTVHQVILFTNSFAEYSADCRVVANHYNITLSGSNLICFQYCCRDFIQSNFETSWTPFHKRNLFIRLQPLHSSVCFFCLCTASVIYRNGHIFIFFRIKVGNLGKEVLRTETRLRNALNITSESFRLCLCRNRSH